MNEKCDRAILDHLDARVSKLDERVTKGGKHLERRLAEVDKHVTEFVGKRDSSVEQRLVAIDQQLLKCTEVQADELKE